MIRGRAVALMIVLSSLALPPHALAQARRERRFDAGVGVQVLGPVHFGRVDADEVTFGGQSKAVFSTKTTLDTALAPEVRVGARLTRTLGIESAMSFSSRLMTTRISGDAERVSGATASERITQYQLAGGLIVRMPPRRPPGRPGRLVPFATIGAGYLRQLHEGRTLVETGQVLFVGGGAEVFIGNRARATKGLRADLRATIPRNGVALDQAVHLVPAFGASLFARF